VRLLLLFAKCQIGVVKQMKTLLIQRIRQTVFAAEAGIQQGGGDVNSLSNLAHRQTGNSVLLQNTCRGIQHGLA
jgi:hypothetical protein